MGSKTLHVLNQLKSVPYQGKIAYDNLKINPKPSKLIVSKSKKHKNLSS